MSLARVVRVDKVLQHKNADNLEIIPLLDRQFITQKGQFMPGDLGILIPQNAIVPQESAYSWLWKDVEPLEPFGHIPYKRRTITPRRFRGEWSSGLLMAPSELSYSISELTEGTDLTEELGIYDDSHMVQALTVTARRWGCCSLKCGREHMPKTFKAWVRYLWHKFK